MTGTAFVDLSAAYGTMNHIIRMQKFYDITQDGPLCIVIHNILEYLQFTFWTSSFVSSNRILPFVYTFSGIFVELLKVIQSAGMC